MNNLLVTKGSQTFINGVSINSYIEVYDLYQAASGNEEIQTTYTVEECKGSEDILVIYKPIMLFGLHRKLVHISPNGLNII